MQSLAAQTVQQQPLPPPLQAAPPRAVFHLTMLICAASGSGDCWANLPSGSLAPAIGTTGPYRLLGSGSHGGRARSAGGSAGRQQGEHSSSGRQGCTSLLHAAYKPAWPGHCDSTPSLLQERVIHILTLGPLTLLNFDSLHGLFWLQGDEAVLDYVAGCLEDEDFEVGRC